MFFKKEVPYSDLFVQTKSAAIVQEKIEYAPKEKQLWLYAIKERLGQTPFTYCMLGDLNGVGITFVVQCSLRDNTYAWTDVQKCAQAFRENSEFQSAGCFLGTAKNYPHKNTHQLFLFVPDTVSAEIAAVVFRKLLPIYMKCTGHEEDYNMPSDENQVWIAEIEQKISEDFGVQFAKYNQKEGAVLNLGCLKNADTEEEANQKVQKIKEQIDEEMSIGGVVSIVDTQKSDKSIVHVFVPMTFTSQEAANLFTCAYRIAKDIVED